MKPKISEILVLLSLCVWFSFMLKHLPSVLIPKINREQKQSVSLFLGLSLYMTDLCYRLEGNVLHSAVVPSIQVPEGECISF